ncbi:hypothetical protein OGATHE_004050 [Ogataea polymorpha]|uniref:Uncharacterized protein n=1 Tax=Ogataea polymorpha TaxID=460523 RepID=A0A9P8P4S4_9ASCO|nr:hypothetical protein OGATHE_004050 [Ogataea polymorpha]
MSDWKSLSYNSGTSYKLAIISSSTHVGTTFQLLPSCPVYRNSENARTVGLENGRHSVRGKKRASILASAASGKSTLSFLGRSDRRVFESGSTSSRADRACVRPLDEASLGPNEGARKSKDVVESFRSCGSSGIGGCGGSSSKLRRRFELFIDIDSFSCPSREFRREAPESLLEAASELRREAGREPNRGVPDNGDDFPDSWNGCLNNGVRDSGVLDSLNDPDKSVSAGELASELGSESSGNAWRSAKALAYASASSLSKRHPHRLRHRLSGTGIDVPSEQMNSKSEIDVDRSNACLPRATAYGGKTDRIELVMICGAT